MNNSWISNNTKKPFSARRKFTVSSTKGASVSCVGVGQFVLFVNGYELEGSVLSGSWTDYNKRIYYYTFDIEKYLREGENEIRAEIGNGWYIADTDGVRHFYTMGSGYKPFGECLAFTAQITADGKVIRTDEGWEVSASATTLANVYGSEDFDARFVPVWERATVLSPELSPKGKLMPIDYPPIIVKRIYEGKHLGGGLYDLGQNMSGLFEIRAKGKAGDIIKVTPYEKLGKDGSPERTVDTWSIYNLSEGECVFCPRFSYAGGRYITVEALSGSPEILSVRGKFITSGSRDVGYFRCSDDRLNKIFDIIKAAIESNLNHCHTDCPTIEKLGWLEPDHLMAPSVFYLKDADKIWSKISADMCDAQYGEGEFDIDEGDFPHEYKAGLIPSTAPRYSKFTHDWGSGSFWDIIPWGSSVILAPWEQFHFYGNKKTMADNYDTACRYIKYLTEQYNDYERLYGKEGKFICAGLGDWGIRQNQGESRENIETAFFYHDLVTMSKIAAALGKPDEFSALAECVKRDYNSALLERDEKSGLMCYRAYDTPSEFRITQANQAIPLCFGLVPDEYRSDVEAALVLSFSDGHFRAGEIGMPYIIRSLARAGRNDLIYAAAVSDEHPSYYRFVKMGETTLPEFWRDDARSRNHDMMGHIMEWLFAEVGGIKVGERFGDIEINEDLLLGLEWSECEYNSPLGRIYVKKEKGKPAVVER